MRTGPWLLSLLATASCAAPGADVHLAPFYTRLSGADGGQRIEIAGGLYREKSGAEDGFLEWRTVGPFFGIDRNRDGRWTAHHPFLLGLTVAEPERTFSYLVPFYYFTRNQQDDGTQTRRLIMLPGWMFKYNPEDGLAFGWFPFVGGFKTLFSYQNVRFVLWPLYVYAERDGTISHHFPWPLIGFTQGNGESSHHVLPLYSKAAIEGRYERWSVLWPFFHYHRDHLGGEGEEPQTTWMFFPLIGRTTRGTYASTTLLWPFFGYASDPRSDFWALDAPFPFVRLQRGPNDEVSRTRFWPLASHVRADGLAAWNLLWPLFHLRFERTFVTERDSFYAVPFWQSWRKTDLTTGEKSSFQKLWPLYKYEKVGPWHRGQFPALNPLQKSELPGRFLTAPLHLWEWEDQGELRRERAFLGLYRRERGRGEDRRSITGLWSNRRYEREDGRTVSETSLLFGLLRWRSVSGEGSGLLRPAFPGPGWPAQRKQTDGPPARTYF